MRIIFTICSNNYLAQAKTLSDSVRKTNPDITFYIFLVDKRSEKIDYEKFQTAIVLPVDEIGIDSLADMILKYNIIELNTAVKPFVFQYLIKENPDCTAIYYFDPDIVVFKSLDFMHTGLTENNFLLTPHILSPIPDDGHLPYDHLFLNFGIYNFGFLGLNPQSSEVRAFLNWWGYKTSNFGFDRVREGLFVDQLWGNLIPLFYRKVSILRHLGCNMAPWNLHERSIAKIENGDFELNDGSSLIFYHFSNFKFSQPDQIAKYYSRYSFQQLPLLKQLYDEYIQMLTVNEFVKYSAIGCVYIKSNVVEVKKESLVKKTTRKFFEKILKLPF